MICVIHFVARPTTFLDTCDFELENICGMIQGQGDNTDWERVTKATGGPDTDYSNMGRCTGTNTFSLMFQHLMYTLGQKGGAVDSSTLQGLEYDSELRLEHVHSWTYCMNRMLINMALVSLLLSESSRGFLFNRNRLLHALQHSQWQ